MVDRSGMKTLKKLEKGRGDWGESGKIKCGLQITNLKISFSYITSINIIKMAKR